MLEKKIFYPLDEHQCYEIEHGFMTLNHPKGVLPSLVDDGLVVLIQAETEEEIDELEMQLSFEVARVLDEAYLSFFADESDGVVNADGSVTRYVGH